MGSKKHKKHKSERRERGEGEICSRILILFINWYKFLPN